MNKSLASNAAGSIAKKLKISHDIFVKLKEGSIS